MLSSAAAAAAEVEVRSWGTGRLVSVTVRVDGAGTRWRGSPSADAQLPAWIPSKDGGLVPRHFRCTWRDGRGVWAAVSDDIARAEDALQLPGHWGPDMTATAMATEAVQAPTGLHRFEVILARRELLVTSETESEWQKGGVLYLCVSAIAHGALPALFVVGSKRGKGGFGVPPQITHAYDRRAVNECFAARDKGSGRRLANAAAAADDFAASDKEGRALLVWSARVPGSALPATYDVWLLRVRADLGDTVAAAAVGARMLPHTEAASLVPLAAATMDPAPLDASAGLGPYGAALARAFASSETAAPLARAASLMDVATAAVTACPQNPLASLLMYGLDGAAPPPTARLYADAVPTADMPALVRACSALEAQQRFLVGDGGGGGGGGGGGDLPERYLPTANRYDSAELAPDAAVVLADGAVAHSPVVAGAWPALRGARLRVTPSIDAAELDVLVAPLAPADFTERIARLTGAGTAPVAGALSLLFYPSRPSGSDFGRGGAPDGEWTVLRMGMKRARHSPLLVDGGTANGLWVALQATGPRDVSAACLTVAACARAAHAHVRATRAGDDELVDSRMVEPSPLAAAARRRGLDAGVAPAVVTAAAGADGGGEDACGAGYEVRALRRTLHVGPFLAAFARELAIAFRHEGARIRLLLRFFGGKLRVHGGGASPERAAGSIAECVRRVRRCPEVAALYASHAWLAGAGVIVAESARLTLSPRLLYTLRSRDGPTAVMLFTRPGPSALSEHYRRREEYAIHGGLGGLPGCLWERRPPRRGAAPPPPARAERIQFYDSSLHHSFDVGAPRPPRALPRDVDRVATAAAGDALCEYVRAHGLPRALEWGAAGCHAVAFEAAHTTSPARLGDDALAATFADVHALAVASLAVTPAAPVALLVAGTLAGHAIVAAHAAALLRGPLADADANFLRLREVVAGAVSSAAAVTSGRDSANRIVPAARVRRFVGDALLARSSLAGIVARWALSTGLAPGAALAAPVHVAVAAAGAAGGGRLWNGALGVPADTLGLRLLRRCLDELLPARLPPPYLPFAAWDAALPAWYPRAGAAARALVDEGPPDAGERPLNDEGGDSLDGPLEAPTAVAISGGGRRPPAREAQPADEWAATMDPAAPAAKRQRLCDESVAPEAHAMAAAAQARYAALEAASAAPAAAMAPATNAHARDMARRLQRHADGRHDASLPLPEPPRPPPAPSRLGPEQRRTVHAPAAAATRERTAARAVGAAPALQVAAAAAAAAAPTAVVAAGAPSTRPTDKAAARTQGSAAPQRAAAAAAAAAASGRAATIPPPPDAKGRRVSFASVTQQPLQSALPPRADALASLASPEPRCPSPEPPPFDAEAQYRAPAPGSLAGAQVTVCRTCAIAFTGSLRDRTAELAAHLRQNPDHKVRPGHERRDWS